MIITCSNCETILTEEDIEIKETKESNLKEGLREIYYITQCCHTKNVIAYKDNNTDRIEEEMIIARKLNDTKRIKALAIKLKNEMDKLKEECYANI